MPNKKPLTQEERERLVVEALQTAAGKKQLREAIGLAAAKAADNLPEGSRAWRLARKLAGLPVKPV
jgi:hypothetical protein